MKTRRATILTSTLLALTLALVGWPTEAEAQSEIRVLVAPLQTESGVDRRFGERVADEIRKALDDFSGMRPVEKKAVEDALKQFQLRMEDLGLIEWRQLAGRLDANSLLVGEARPVAGGVEVTARFIDPRTGDELPIDPFTVEDDGKHREAAAQISAGLEEQVAFGRAVVFCNEYLGSDQYEDAMRNCQQALAINPGSSQALYLRGRVHMEIGDHQAAAEDLERVIEAQPSNTDALQSLAYTHAVLGNQDRAQQLYQDYLTFNPDDADVRLNVAFNLAREGAHQAAIEILSEGVERDPEHAGMWEYLGNVALAKGTQPVQQVTQTSATGAEGAEAAAAQVAGAGDVTDTEAVRLAVRAYERVLELKGDSISPGILQNVIAAYIKMGDHDEALAFSDRALTMIRQAPEGAELGGEEEAVPPAGETPGLPEEAAGQNREQMLANIHSLRADIFGGTEDFGRAVAEMDRVLEIDPDYRNAYMKRGVLRLKNGNTEGAVADFRLAVDRGGQDPNQVAQTLFGQGYNDYFQQGDFGTAIDMFETALEFVQEPQLRQQVNFFAAYGYYQWGTGIDSRNEEAEACQPARRALNIFQQVAPHLGQSGNYQAQSQGQIREAVDVQIYRQEQIVRKSCQ